MTDASTTNAAVDDENTPESRRGYLIELWIVILLGVVSVATAYATFQAALYDGNQASAYSQGQTAQTEAESLYLEANQQFVQDTQTLSRLMELEVASRSADPIAAAVASETYDTVYFQNVSEDLDAAITRAAEANEADPENYTDPQADEDYQAALYGAWSEKDDEAKAVIAKGDTANNYGDRLTLAATLMAITLFLLGVAAVVRRPRTKVILTGVGVVVFAGSSAIAAMVPFVWF